MSRNNDVFQTLVTSGNQVVLAEDSTLGDLAAGQIGVFDFDTNLAIDATSQKPRGFYLATGLTGGDIAKSSGSNIQSRNIQFYQYRDYEAGVPMKAVLSGYTADCETEYGVKLEMRNQEIYRTQGYNQFTKTYSIVTSCCSGCTPTCPSGDANEITKLLKIEINNDPIGLITAIAIARHTLTKATIDAVVVGTPFSGDIAIGGTVSDADLIILEEYNAAQADTADHLYTDLEITTVTQALNTFGDLNLMYFWPRQTIVIPAIIEGFACNGSVATTQAAVFEEGSGYDIKQLEYEAKGWKESPYRVSTLNGVADPKVYAAVEATNYSMIALTYDQFSVGAWLEYYNNLASIVAIPTADTVTRDALLVILNAFIPGDIVPQAG